MHTSPRRLGWAAAVVVAIGAGLPAPGRANPIFTDSMENEACRQTLREPGCIRCGSLREVDPLSITPGDPGLDACREYLDDGYRLRCRVSRWGNYYVVCRDPSYAEPVAPPRARRSRRREPAAPVEPAKGCAVGRGPPRGAPLLGLAVLAALGGRRRKRRPRDPS